MTTKFDKREITYHVVQARFEAEEIIHSPIDIDRWDKGIRPVNRLTDSFEFADRSNASRVATYLNRSMTEAGFDDVAYYIVTNDQNQTSTVSKDNIPERFHEHFGFIDEPEEETEIEEETETEEVEEETEEE